MTFVTLQRYWNLKVNTTLKYVKAISIFVLLGLLGCKETPKISNASKDNTLVSIEYARGFSIEKFNSGITVLKITSPWPNAESAFTYALVPKENLSKISLDKNKYDAIIATPVSRVVVTSTTHIPALESLGVLDKLVGFPDTDYISSTNARKLIEAGKIKELGRNESLNTEMVLDLRPELVVGFSINAQNKAYSILEQSNIPVVYNGDWTEENPLGKAEWIKFFAPFFLKEKEADQIFRDIEKGYTQAMEIGERADASPTVISGAMYKDVWYLPGGQSWAAQFLEDANSNYLWANTPETGSLSLSWEHVLEKGQNADFWIAPAQFTNYDDMKNASEHYTQFDAFKNRKIYTFSKTKGATGGILYYELAPQRPDLVLKDLIHILHPSSLPNYKPFFFTPLE